MKREIKIFIFVLIILMVSYLLINTYSKYNDEAEGTIEQEVGRWNIKINGTDVIGTSGTPTEFTIDNFVWDTDSHVTDGKVAPGMKGQFEIEIDPKDTDVSIEYSIKIDNSRFTESNDINLKIKKIILDGEEYEFTSVPVIEEVENELGEIEEIVTNTEIKISFVKPLSEIQSNDDDVRIDSLLVDVEWENNEEFNEKDSEIGRVPNNIISLPITVDLIQYTGEESEP